MNFTHLHVHSQYSILDGATPIPKLIDKAIANGMQAVALTDHGSMFGIKLFYDTCRAKGIKPILGCETYVARNGHLEKSSRSDRSGEHLILLAKNLVGYHNLIELISIAHTEGKYYKPRIDKQLLAKYHEGLIVSSACLGGEICQKIMAGNVEGAEETAKWFKNLMGDDYYLEVISHPNHQANLEKEVYGNQKICNKEILRIGKKLNIQVIATNDVHFLNKEDAGAHDLLICLNTGRDIDDPKRLRYTRQEWFKTSEEMAQVFPNNPEVLENTMEIADKIENYDLDSNAIMPVFPIPEDFGTEKEYETKFSEADLQKEFGEKRYKKLSGDYKKILRIKFESDYLTHLTYEGAKVRWKDGIPEDVQERLIFELETIKTMGFPGYFLIVHDFIKAARDMGVIVGPGRGSAAGSVVAYSLGITNINPIKYDLLFERFLNPDRISMPDIDIDFDDEGRQKVMEWVTAKYGKNRVSHIVTFGSMAAKMSIKDVARVLKLDLSIANRLAKLVPNTPKITLKRAFEEVPELNAEKNSPNPLIAKTLEMAQALEGSIRQTGVHACGIIISRDPLTDHIPVMPTDGESLLTTQYDGHFVEPIGLLKMDFLGLRTLSIFKSCLKNIKETKNLDISLDDIPLDDKLTFELFSNGETTGLFQFESPGMKKHLKALKPNRFEDLVAMNALYRPGPMEYIPTFIKRKHGEEEIKYDHPLMEPFLKDTYGVTVYQEQVMLQSRALGNFTRGMSDTLRKAMGKKKKKVMDELKVKFHKGCLGNPKFIEGAKEVNKKPEDLIEKIWKDWEEFTKYAFNKSHSVCYAYIAYLTGFLKAHYPAEFMAANLSNNLSQIDKVTTFMDECKRMGLEVLTPDVNESLNDFTVNTKDQIRFGMAAIKGVGDVPGSEIIKERKKNGKYEDIYDFFRRTNFRSINKRTIENLITAGGFDSFGYHRAQLINKFDEKTSVLENLVSYGQQYQEEQFNKQISLFANDEFYNFTLPEIPECEKWSDYNQATKEKELIGIYLTSHPLDSYTLEMNLLCTPIKQLNDNESIKLLEGKTITIGGTITATKRGKTKKGNDFGIFTLEDYQGSYEIALFGSDFVNYNNYMLENSMVYVTGKIDHKYRNENNPLTLNIDDMGLLMSITKNAIKSVTIQFDVNGITPKLIKEIHDNFLKKEDNNNNNNDIILPEMNNDKLIDMKVELYDKFNNTLNMHSSKYKILCNKDLLNYFKANKSINLIINS